MGGFNRFKSSIEGIGLFAVREIELILLVFHFYDRVKVLL